MNQVEDAVHPKSEGNREMYFKALANDTFHFVERCWLLGWANGFNTSVVYHLQAETGWY